MHSKLDAALNSFGLQHADLYSVRGGEKLDSAFAEFVAKVAPAQLDAWRALQKGSLGGAEHSQLALSLAPVLETFMASMLGIEQNVAKLHASVLQDNAIFQFQKKIVMSAARKRLHKTKQLLPEFSQLQAQLESNIDAKLAEIDPELAVANYACSLLANADQSDQYSDLVDWAASALCTAEGQAAVAGWLSFKLPQRLDFDALVATEVVAQDPPAIVAPKSRLKSRVGFSLLDHGLTQREALYEMHYCILCHTRNNDTCSKGFPKQKQKYKDGFKLNASDYELIGCPLEQKISEMNQLMQSGFAIAALAMVMVDNPLVPLTGQRICNDCSQACIYQKQSPVDVPQAETAILRAVLALPYGVEIYSLLLRWNPLRQSFARQVDDNGRRVLVMGMGPAGIAMAREMLQAGYGVVAMDGLLLQPFNRVDLLQPVQDYKSITSDLSKRQVLGFGGVAEYGITVRWDKNFLNLVFLAMLRYANFQPIGSIRFGGTLTIQDARRYQFDHLCLAVGAGLPKALSMPGSLAPGMRMANEFLMSLHLLSAAKTQSLVDIGLQMPIVVIGGGLTAIDTATEAAAYYLVLIEKVLSEFNKLSEVDKQKLQVKLGKKWRILETYCAHAKHWQAEQRAAARDGREPNAIATLGLWGGVSIVYRRDMQQSPAYREFAHEIQAALDQGIRYIEGLQPEAAVLDDTGRVKALRCQRRELQADGSWQASSDSLLLPACSVLLATGSQPNIAYEYEHRGSMQRKDNFYAAYNLCGEQLEPAVAAENCKSDGIGIFTSQACAGMHVSFIGDCHPDYAGSVVKALASAKNHFPDLHNHLQSRSPLSQKPTGEFIDEIVANFTTRLERIQHLNAKWARLIVKAPQAAEAYQLGQFYRLQTVNLDCEMQINRPLAAQGIYCEQNPDCLEFIVNKNIASGRALAELQPGTNLALMGPTGAKEKLPAKNVLVIGGAMAIIAMRARFEAWLDAGIKVVFVCTASGDDLFELNGLQSIIKKIHQVDVSEKLENWFDFLQEWSSSGAQWPFALEDVAAVYVWDSPAVSAQLNRVRDCFPQASQLSAAVYGDMQCMLKGVCAQCLQWQIDPQTGERTKAVYSCSWQQQPLEMVDWPHLQSRQAQNEVLDSLRH